MAGQLGSSPPIHNPRATFTGPATRPFNCTICSGSDNEILRVRLLSSPQAMHAPTIANGPTTLETVISPDHESTAAPATRQPMPNAIRRSKFSWKRNQAMSAVATPSRVRRSDAAAAAVRVSPTNRSTGAIIPPATIAPASHGISARPKPTSLALGGGRMEPPSRRSTATPTPAPQ